jgi:hypothetical protein
MARRRVRKSREKKERRAIFYENELVYIPRQGMRGT